MGGLEFLLTSFAGVPGGPKNVQEPLRIYGEESVRYASAALADRLINQRDLANKLNILTVAVTTPQNRNFHRKISSTNTMRLPFPHGNDLELVSDNAATHTVAIPAEISEIPALCRIRLSSRTSRKHDCSRPPRRHRPAAAKPAPTPGCTDRWVSSPANGINSLPVMTTATQAKHMAIAQSRCRCSTAPALDVSPRQPHRSDSIVSADEILESSNLVDVLEEALQLADDLSERCAPRHLSSDEDKVEVVARTG